MDWNNYPQTMDLIDAAQLSSCKGQEFETLFRDASISYARENVEGDELSRESFKVYAFNPSNADLQSRVQNRRYGKSKNSTFNSPPLTRMSVSYEDDLLWSPEPQFATLEDEEEINFNGVHCSVDKLKDQCTRLMGSLETSRRELKQVKGERDHYKKVFDAHQQYTQLLNLPFHRPPPARIFTHTTHQTSQASEP